MEVIIHSPNFYLHIQDALILIDYPGFNLRIAKYAKILPGDGGPTRPASVATHHRSAEIPPAHIATIIIG